MSMGITYKKRVYKNSHKKVCEIDPTTQRYENFLCWNLW